MNLVVASKRDNRLVVQTLLSRKPRENSLLVAVTSVLVMLVISQLCWQSGQELQAALAAGQEGVFLEGKYWKLFTAMLVHADMQHFLSNALLFAMFSYLLFGYFGFWVYPTISFLLGAAVNYLALLTYGDHVKLIGASGLVYLMAGFWLTCYLLIERSKTVGRRIMNIVGVGVLLLLPTAFKPSVSYRSHSIGLGLGIVSAILFFVIRRHSIRSAEELQPAESSDQDPTEPQYLM